MLADSSIVKAHQHRSGVEIPDNECIGKNSGGNSTKIHLVVDTVNYQTISSYQKAREMILVVPEVLLTQKVVKRLYQSEIMDKISTKKAWIGVSTSIDFWLRMLSRGLRNSIQYQRDMISCQEVTPVCYHWRLLYVAALMCKRKIHFIYYLLFLKR